jgi:23S rRNA U2552 (ribose-2'-O)-methylase RlmE/FtsJ
MHRSARLFFSRVSASGRKGSFGSTNYGKSGSKVKNSSSKEWIRKHVDDHFVQRSVKENKLSRAYYKLEELDTKEKIVHAKRAQHQQPKKGETKAGPSASSSSPLIIDLGAAPGGWSQYCIEKNATVIAIDLLDFNLPGLHMKVLGDFTDARMQKRLTDEISTFASSSDGTQDEGERGGREVRVVLSDMASNFSGNSTTDALRNAQLGKFLLWKREEEEVCIISQKRSYVLK